MPVAATVQVCAKHRHYSGNRHYSAYCPYWLFPLAPAIFTGTVADNPHYSNGTTGTTTVQVYRCG